MLTTEDRDRLGQGDVDVLAIALTAMSWTWPLTGIVEMAVAMGLPSSASIAGCRSSPWPTKPGRRASIPPAIPSNTPIPAVRRRVTASPSAQRTVVSAGATQRTRTSEKRRYRGSLALSHDLRVRPMGPKPRCELPCQG